MLRLNRPLKSVVSTDVYTLCCAIVNNQSNLRKSAGEDSYTSSMLSWARIQMVRMEYERIYQEVTAELNSQLNIRR